MTDVNRQPASEEDMGAITELAQQVRHAMWFGTVEALAQLGDPPPWVSTSEAALRVNIHDSVL